MKRTILMMLAVAMMAGCASTLPPRVSIDKDYNTLGVKTASVNMDCENVKTDDIDPDSVPDFCQMIHASAKSSIRKTMGYKIIEDDADIDINIKLEEIYGGNAAARFWVGLGAGRSVITTSVEIVKNGTTIAEGRLFETSTLPNISGNAWSNEDMIRQDIGIIGGKIANFVANPREFEARPEQTGYRP